MPERDRGNLGRLFAKRVAPVEVHRDTETLKLPVPRHANATPAACPVCRPKEIPGAPVRVWGPLELPLAVQGKPPGRSVDVAFPSCRPRGEQVKGRSGRLGADTLTVRVFPIGNGPGL